MRRSRAPSSLLKRRTSGSSSPAPNKLPKMTSMKRAVDDGESGSDSDSGTTTPTPVKFQELVESDASYEQRIRQILYRPFKCPIPGYTGSVSGRSGLGVKRLTVRKALHDPEADDAVILYAPPELSATEKAASVAKKHPVHVVVDPVLGRCLRPHQVEGVQFLYNAVTGRLIEGFQGCIMADEMGLGKTFQCVTLVWTLLKQSPDCCPTIKKAIIVCPSSLVKNWYNEFGKWLGNRIVPVAVDGGKEKTLSTLQTFIKSQGRVVNPVLVISYESLRMYKDILCSQSVGIVICDEGHRLKNCQNLTYQALMELKTKRRIILSGTPVQNELLEYYSLVEFCNPGLLGLATEFRKKYETPILRSRDSMATDKELEIGKQRLQELVQIVNQCVIRRTNDILSKYLPPKIEQVVCCRLSKLQLAMYKALCGACKGESSDPGALKDANANDGSGSRGKGRGKKAAVKKEPKKKGAISPSLAFITDLKKLCNHPHLLTEKIKRGDAGFHVLKEYLPLLQQSMKRCSPQLSGKLAVLDVMLANLKAQTTDKIVLVSNYTQTLDLFEDLSRLRGYQYVRLDGSMTIKKRQKMVDRFNDPTSSDFIFMLSSKAGGCGLNLIGANRLVMFDPDWNPANDEQAMARVWRDGQRKLCYVYRFVATGTIEEKILQRQAHKKALSTCVVDDGEDVERHFSRDDLRQLFVLDENCTSSTHTQFKCKKCSRDGTYSLIPPTGEVKGIPQDLAEWDHHPQPLKTTKDRILASACGERVSFVYRSQSHEGMLDPRKRNKKQDDDDDDGEGEDRDEEQGSEEDGGASEKEEKRRSDGGDDE